MNVNGLYSILLVKTAHKNYPQASLATPERGEWNAATATLDNVSLLATKYMDLQAKQFISTCSTSLDGLVKRPEVAHDYLSYAAGIDIFNHFCTDGTGIEDVWHTKSPHIRQFAGVLSFVFTNAYPVMRYFKCPTMKHLDFKMQLAKAMMEFTEEQFYVTRSSSNCSIHAPKALTEVSKNNKVKQRNCFYCQHMRNPPKPKVKCLLVCLNCDIQICSPMVRDCWQLHVLVGKSLLKKKYQWKDKTGNKRRGSK